VSLVLGRLQRWRSRARVQAAAQARLRATEAAVGRRLSRGEWRTIRAYAIDVLGHEKYALELARYTLAAGEFRSGWMPDRFFMRWVVPYLNARIAPIARLRTLSRALLPDLPTPDLLTFVRGAWWTLDGERLTPAEARARLFAAAPEVLMKAEGTTGGHGVRIVRASDDLAAFAARGENALFQRRIVQHPDFDAFAPGGATTLKLLTVLLPAARFGAEAEAPLVASLRSARIGYPVGRWKFGGAGSIEEAIDVATGVSVGVARDEDYRTFSHHPDGGAAFQPRRVPGFAAAAEAALGWHARLPWAGVLGWDVVVDPQGVPWPVECNGRYPALGPTEPVTGPAFADLGWERLRTPPA
jgi:hypothetical protein